MPISTLYPNVAKVEGAADPSVKNAAVVIYCKPLTTQEMRCHRLSRRVNNMNAFHSFQDAIWSSFQQNS